MLKTQFLDVEYEFKLIKLIIGEKIKAADGKDYIDTRFGRESIEMLDEELFSSSFSKTTIKIIKQFYLIYKKIPKYSEILVEANFLEESKTFKNELKRFLSQTIYSQTIDNEKWIKEKFKTYLIQQTIAKFCETTLDDILTGKEVHETIEGFNFKLKQLQKKLFSVSRPVELTEDISFLEENEGYYVPLGWGDDFDETINLRQGSLVLAVIPTGVGKTTSAVITAIHNFLQGKNVLLIFFEDDYTDLYKKIYSKLSGCGIGEIKRNFNMITDLGKHEIIEARNKGGNLIMMKLSQTNSNPNHIRRYIDYFEATYGKLYLLVLDYLDCLNSSFDKNYKDEYQEQGDVIVDVLEMVSDLEYNIAALSYVQSGRAGLNNSMVEASNSSGSIKRIFKAPQVITVSKTSSQKSNKTANVLIEKNRKGESGIFYRDVIFDNGRVHIDVSNVHIEEIEDVTG